MSSGHYSPEATRARLLEACAPGSAIGLEEHVAGVLELVVEARARDRRRVAELRARALSPAADLTRLAERIAYSGSERIVPR